MDKKRFELVLLHQKDGSAVYSDKGESGKRLFFLQNGFVEGQGLTMEEIGGEAVECIQTGELCCALYCPFKPLCEFWVEKGFFRASDDKSEEESSFDTLDLLKVALKDMAAQAMENRAAIPAE